ncbi:MarR family winged helix-turn-helix transcriptional regulator [Marinobacterium litorale]|uniref:MarR family winged helix-turn-helix transcriptional regulator n=1 Tax=Marinobacterium litorale TaxID=404770 RepID=UPI000688AD15|nr:MarR family winged helix-turn-helix transcriptional regulator [Marinobacterium litorale]
MNIIKSIPKNMGTDSETTGPSLSEERIAHIIRQCARDFYNSLEKRLQPYGVNHGFWAYLRELWVEEGISQRDLSERVGLTGPTTNSVIKRMEAAGLVELRPIVEGKPRRVVYLTKRGRELRDILEPLAKEVNDIAVAGMEHEEVVLIRNLLLRIHTNLAMDNQ